MSTFSLDIVGLKKELKEFSSWAGAFLENGSKATLDGHVTALEVGLLRTPLGTTFEWPPEKDGEVKPIRTTPSRTYKGGGDHRPMMAESRFQWKCGADPDDPKRLSVYEGYCELRFFDPANAEDAKVIHFDVCRGGYADQAGHPPLHVQFHGMIQDMPRLPMFVSHPLDVLDFALLELHQAKWRQHLAETKVKSQMRSFPARQRGRILAALNGWKDLLEQPHSRHAFVAFQEVARAPLSFG